MEILFINSDFIFITGRHLSKFYFWCLDFQTQCPLIKDVSIYVGVQEYFLGPKTIIDIVG